MIAIMPIRESLNAVPTSLGEVLSNGKRYKVPMFQRDYAWGESEWAELWSDLAAVLAGVGDPHHFLGAIVLQPAREPSLMNIIDGQQRLVTLSLLALATIGVIERLAEEGADRESNLERARLLRERFVSTKDPASLQHRSRLELNATDDGFYQTHLVQGLAPIRPSGLKGSERRLYDCLQWFSKQVEALHPGRDGASLASFLDKVAGRLRFIEIRVEDDETAFTVFETLNARGVALGTADLLKNYLFAQAAKGGANDLRNARLLWERVLEEVPHEEVTSLLFYNMAADVQGLREKRVFAEVKRLVPVQRNVFEFLRELVPAAELYAALDDPHDDFWNRFTLGTRHWVGVLNTLRVEQYKALVLAAFDRFTDRPDKLERLFRNLAVILMRATIAKVNTGDIQRAFHDAAWRIKRGELKNPLPIARSLAPITPSDDVFRAAFEALEIPPRGPRKRLLKYILAELEQASGGSARELDALDVTIEHILPDSPAAGWPGFSHEEHARFASRLGNLTPLEGRHNHDLGAAPFERKRTAYAQSRFALTRGIMAQEWTPDSLRQRQREMALHAVTVWPTPTEE